MFSLPPSVQLSSNPVVTAVLPGTNVTVNKNIGDVTVSSGGGGGGSTQTVVRYVASDGGSLFLQADFATAYTGTITTTAASSLITATCMNIATSANPGYVQARIVINGVVSSPVYEYPIISSAATDVRSYALQGAYRAPTPGTYTVNVQFSDPGVTTATTMGDGTLILMTNMSG